VNEPVEIENKSKSGGWGFIESRQDLKIEAGSWRAKVLHPFHLRLTDSEFDFAWPFSGDPPDAGEAGETASNLGLHFQTVDVLAART